MPPPTDWTNATGQLERCSCREQKKRGVDSHEQILAETGPNHGVQATAASVRCSRCLPRLTPSVRLRQLHRNGFAFHFYLRDAIPGAFDIGDC